MTCFHGVDPTTFICGIIVLVLMGIALGMLIGSGLK
jgi:hypothetical protein